MTTMMKPTLLCGLGAPRRDNRALDSGHLPRWVQELGMAEKMSVRARTGLAVGGERTDDKYQAKSSTTEFKMGIENAGAALHRA